MSILASTGGTLTPASSTSAYCTGAQFLVYHDARSIGDCLADNDSRVTGPTLANHPVLLAMLNWASGEVERACMVGQRYMPADLQNLINASPPQVGAESLRGLVADLAFWKLAQRRKYGLPMPKELGDALNLLRNGERIFGFLEAAEAGTTDVAGFMQQSDFNTLGLTTTLARRYFGRRSDVLRLGQQGAVGTGD